jgi:hypothetical protein
MMALYRCAHVGCPITLFEEQNEVLLQACPDYALQKCLECATYVCPQHSKDLKKCSFCSSLFCASCYSSDQVGCRITMRGIKVCAACENRLLPHCRDLKCVRCQAPLLKLFDEETQVYALFGKACSVGRYCKRDDELNGIYCTECARHYMRGCVSCKTPTCSICHGIAKQHSWAEYDYHQRNRGIEEFPDGFHCERCPQN